MEEPNNKCFSTQTQKNELYIKKSRQNSRTTKITPGLFNIGKINNLIWYNRLGWCIR